MVQILGARRFAGFYLAASAATAAFHLTYTRYVAPRLSSSPLRFFSSLDTPSLGASGATTATMGAATVMLKVLLLFNSCAHHHSGLRGALP